MGSSGNLTIAWEALQNWWQRWDSNLTTRNPNFKHAGFEFHSELQIRGIRISVIRDSKLYAYKITAYGRLKKGIVTGIKSLEIWNLLTTKLWLYYGRCAFTNRTIGIQGRNTEANRIYFHRNTNRP